VLLAAADLVITPAGAAAPEAVQDRPARLDLARAVQ